MEELANVIDQIESADESSCSYGKESEKQEDTEQGDRTERSDTVERSEKTEHSDKDEEVIECGKSNVKVEDSMSIGKALNSMSGVSREQVMKELDNLSHNPEAIDKVINSMGADKQLLNSMSGKNAAALANNPEVKRIAREAKEKISRKQALKMNKALNKGLNKGSSSKPKVQGVMVNLSKKLKPYLADKEGNSVNTEQIGRSLNAQMLKSVTTDEYVIYYDLRAPSNNKAINRMFPNLELGNQIIMFRKDLMSLSVEELDKKNK